MATSVIEINDAGIIASVDREIVVESPGYALLDNGDLLVGKPAYEAARLKPRWTSNRFWRDLSLDPLPNATAQAGTSADLAFAHLKAIWSQVSDRAEQAMFAVPGTFSSEQLGLLAGMAGEAGIPLMGMVDSALAAAVTRPLSGDVLHLDIQLHRVVLSSFEIGASIARDASFVIVESGQKQMRDAWINSVADMFVRTTRFDPMHTAETEQKLYNTIGDWLAGLDDRNNAQFEMEAGGKTHQVMVHMDKLISSNAEVFPQLVQQLRARIRDEGATVLLSHRLKSIPGLHQTLELIPGCDVEQLDVSAVTTGVMDNLAALQSADDSLRFVTSLNRGMSRRVASGTDADLPTPTHVLYRSRAYRINEQPFLMGAEIPGGAQGINLTSTLAGVSRKHCAIVCRDGDVIVEDHSTYGTYINDERVNGSAVLAIGDFVRIGSPGVSVELIQIQD